MQRILSLVIVLSLAASLAGLRLELRERAFVSASQVRLCDVATRIAGERDLFEQLSDTVVLDLPWELQYRNLYAAEVANRVREKTGCTIEVAGGVCVVRWQQQNIGQEYIRLTADGFVFQALGLGDNARVTIERIPDVRAPQDAFELRYTLVSQNPRMLVLRGVVLVEGREVHNFLLQARVEVTREVLTLRTAKRRGDAITAEDVTTIKQAGNYLSTSLTSLDALQSRQAARYMAAGTVLDAGNTETCPAVERGDPIIVIVSSGSVQLTLEAVAKRRGQIGDIIECENTATRQRFKALVTGHGRAEVNLED
ncbi:MAG: flagellar basal body P-ring formation chaperone FlgA [Candidatus Cloacimonetes bacterium]|nr:flagellar basal body P-ring formation chaperone FlgA [Candidatus Cloacimonadota bacterium]